MDVIGRSWIYHDIRYIKYFIFKWMHEIRTWITLSIVALSIAFVSREITSLAGRKGDKSSLKYLHSLLLFSFRMSGLPPALSSNAALFIFNDGHAACNLQLCFDRARVFENVARIRRRIKFRSGSAPFENSQCKIDRP